GGGVGGDVEVGPPHLRHGLEKLVKAYGHVLLLLVAPGPFPTEGGRPKRRPQSTVSRRPSSMVVTPLLIFSRPLMRRVSMPSSSAFVLISTVCGALMMRA